MKKRILYIILIAMTIWVFIGVRSGVIEKYNQEEKLSLSISLNKINFKLGDEFVVNYDLKNMGKNKIAVLPWGFEYATNKLFFYGKENKNKLKVVRLLIYGLRFIPKKEDIVYLMPQESFSKKFRGVIKKGILRSISKEVMYIDFKNSAVVLDNNTGYIIKAVFKTDKEIVKKVTELYDINKGIYSNETTSNEISFNVK